MQHNHSMTNHKVPDYEFHMPRQLTYPLPVGINGVLFKLDKCVAKPDKAMNDEVLGKSLWDELVRLTELTPELAGIPRTTSKGAR